jgi:L-iditol 2-dehydrogenase
LIITDEQIGIKSRTIMKALVLHSPERLIYEADWSAPEVPYGWVLVKVHASGICGSDLPRIMQTGAYHHPMIPGHEFSGEVIDPGGSNLLVGSRVAVLPIIPCGKCEGCKIGPFHCTHYDFIGSRRDGGFCQYCAVPVDNLFSLPENLAYEEGAFIEPIAVTLHVVRRSGMTMGSRVLVFGAGAIGILTAQWAQILGAAEVVIADLRDASLAIAQNCGLEKTINPRSDLFSSSGNFDFVFEAAGSTPALVSGIEHAAPRSTLTLVGREVKDTIIPLPVFERMMRKELNLAGCWGYDLRGDTRLVYQMLEEGKLKLGPMITHRLELQEGPKFIQDMWARSFFYCKVQFVL